MRFLSKMPNCAESSFLCLALLNRGSNNTEYQQAFYGTGQHEKKNAPRKNAGLSSICGYCKTPLDTLEQTKMATPKRKASGSNPLGDATANRLKQMQRYLFQPVCLYRARFVWQKSSASGCGYARWFRLTGRLFCVIYKLYWTVTLRGITSALLCFGNSWGFIFYIV